MRKKASTTYSSTAAQKRNYYANAPTIKPRIVDVSDTYKNEIKNYPKSNTTILKGTNTNFPKDGYFLWPYLSDYKYTFNGTGHGPQYWTPVPNPFDP